MVDQPQTQDEYDQVVTSIAGELAGEIDDGVSRNIARQLVAGVKIHNGSPVVQQSAQYEGGPVEAIDRTLYPMVVLQFTRIDSLTESKQPDPQIWVQATAALAADLRAAHQQTANMVGEDSGR
jgi:hypothetical protein